MNLIRFWSIYYSLNSIPLNHLNPEIHLNLFVLFISNYGQNYEKSLKGLSEVIKFFQGKDHFNGQNSDATGINELENVEDIRSLFTRLMIHYLCHLFETSKWVELTFTTLNLEM